MTDFNEIIKYCIANDIEFEINKRFANDAKIEFVFNINVNFGDKVQDHKRIQYTASTNDDETADILSTIDVYLHLDPSKNIAL